MGSRRKDWIVVRGHQGSVVFHPIALPHSQEHMAAPFPWHGRSRRLGSRLSDPDWRRIEAASDGKRACWDGLSPVVAETLGVDQALSVPYAAVDRVQLVASPSERWRLAVVILRRTRKVQCQGWLRAVLAGVGDPVGCPNCRLRPQSLQTLRPQNRLRLLRLRLLLRRRRRRRRRIRSGVHDGGRLRAV